MIKNKTQVLAEGRYDSLVRTITKDVMNSIIDSEGEFSPDYSLPYDYGGQDKYIHESGLSVEVELLIKRTTDTLSIGNNEVPYFVYSYVSIDGPIVIELTIDDTYGRDFYEEIFYKINEDIRHEIEHELQIIFNDREQSLIPNSSDYETTFKHHMDPSEVAALVHGFYRRAKLEKKTLDSIMLDDIKKEISNGEITPSEGDKLLQTWISYSVKHLPYAQFTNSTKRRFSFKK
jgi:hypothetical protein